MLAYNKLRGRLVLYFNPKRSGLCAGMVRKVVAGPRTGLKFLVVQRPSNPDAKSPTARYQGETLKLEGDAVRGVAWYGKVLPLAEFLQRVEAAQ